MSRLMGLGYDARRQGGMFNPASLGASFQSAGVGALAGLI
jgi:hypothetical protein